MPHWQQNIERGLGYCLGDGSIWIWRPPKKGNLLNISELKVSDFLESCLHRMLKMIESYVDINRIYFPHTIVWELLFFTARV